MDFDLSKYELSDTATFRLKNARGDDDLIGTDGNAVTVEVFSPGSDEGVKATHRFSRKVAMRRIRTEREGRLLEDEAEAAERDYVEKLVGFTKGFSENFPVKPFDVYSNPRLAYIAKQVDEAIGKYGTFSKGPSGS